MAPPRSMCNLFTVSGYVSAASSAATAANVSLGDGGLLGMSCRHAALRPEHVSLHTAAAAGCHRTASTSRAIAPCIDVICRV